MFSGERKLMTNVYFKNVVQIKLLNSHEAQRVNLRGQVVLFVEMIGARIDLHVSVR